MAALAILVLILATILFLIAALSFRRNRKAETSKLPPGNMGWPLIGETLSFLKPHPAAEVGEFMKHRISRFGTIFKSHLLGRTTIVSADAEFSRYILKNDLRLFGPGWSTSFVKLMGETSISVLVGDAHKHMRSIVVDFLGGQRLRTAFLRDAEQVATMILGSLKEGTVISAKDVATKFSFYIAVKEILSMAPGDSEVEKLMEAYHVFVRGLGAIPLSIPGTTYWKALQSREEILKLIKQKINERTRNIGDADSSQEKDLLSSLMKNTEYSPEQIGALLLQMLFAGHDTTSRAISLLIYFLEACPKAVKQLQEEHIQAVRFKEQRGENSLTWEDYKNMEFTRCVIDETLRLGNVASFTGKKATTEIEFRGYVIPCGCKIMLSLLAVHLDPTLFENPNVFNPWRWLKSTSGSSKTNFMAFGGGPRLCPGAELARLEMTVFLHHLVLNYKWELVEDDHPQQTVIVNFPKGLRIKIQASAKYK